MKQLKSLKSEYGELSIETSINMTVVFLVLLLLMVMSHIMYEQTRLNAIAQDAAERAGIIYSVAGKDMVMGKVNPDSFKDTSPYWRLFDNNKSSRINTVKNYILMKLNAYKINENRYTADDITIKYKDYFVYKRITVAIDTEYKVPFGGILNIFIPKDYPIHAYAEAAVNEQAEMIRNVDMVADIVGQLTEGTAVGDFLEKYQSKINEIASKISG